MTTAIEAKHLVKVYPTRPPVEALRDFSLFVEKGETLGILGPNGAGKTTFIRILLGIILPTEGSISVLGVNPSLNPEIVTQNVRFVPETPFLNKRWTLWENARYWFTLWEEKWEQKKVLDILEQFDLLDRATEPINRYSRGMQQRAGLALALASSAPIVILDEPTLGLDVLGVQETLKILTDFKAKGKTILFASHDMNFVEKLADSVALVAQGRVLNISQVGKFRRQYGKEYLKLRYLLPGKPKEIVENILIDGQFSEQTLLESVYKKGGTLLELRRDLQPLDMVVGSFFLNNS